MIKNKISHPKITRVDLKISIVNMIYKLFKDEKYISSNKVTQIQYQNPTES